LLTQVVLGEVLTCDSVSTTATFTECELPLLDGIGIEGSESNAVSICEAVIGGGSEGFVAGTTTAASSATLNGGGQWSVVATDGGFQTTNLSCFF
jgi:hypothetical protein